MGGQSSPREERRLEAARGYLALHMPDHALREIDAIGRGPADAFAVHQLRGEALRQAGEISEAVVAFGKALAEEPNDSAVLMSLAWCYKRNGQLAQAITAMQQAYCRSPREPVLLYNLACYFALAGRKAQALSWLGRALRMDASLHRLVRDEPDFDRLRHDPHFRFIVDAVAARRD